MSTNSVGQYTGTYKVWDHVGNVTPDFVVSEGVNPVGQFRPAAWLPVSFYDKYFEVWKVITAGKIVAFDNDGRVIPAQYGLSGATITYTTDDVDAGVIDVRTGSALQSSATGTFNVSAVTAFMGRSGEAMSVSKPIGLAFYDFFQDFDSTSGDGDNPVYYKQHNFRLQHRVAIICDSLIEMPLVPASQSATNLGAGTKASGESIVDFAALSNLPVAKNTDRTPITFTNGTGSDASTRFVNEVDSRSDIAQLGDWYIDLDTGVISCYGTANIASGTYQVAYYHYASNPSTLSAFACAMGDLEAGDFVKCGTGSNFVVDASPTVADTIGQVLEVITYPQDNMDMVRTAYKPPLATDATGLLPGYDGQADQSPGSATGGVPLNVHYSGASNKVVRINLFAR